MAVIEASDLVENRGVCVCDEWKKSVALGCRFKRFPMIFIKIIGFTRVIYYKLQSYYLDTVYKINYDYYSYIAIFFLKTSSSLIRNWNLITVLRYRSVWKIIFIWRVRKLSGGSFFPRRETVLDVSIFRTFSVFSRYANNCGRLRGHFFFFCACSKYFFFVENISFTYPLGRFLYGTTVYRVCVYRRACVYIVCT